MWKGEDISTDSKQKWIHETTLATVQNELFESNPIMKHAVDVSICPESRQKTKKGSRICDYSDKNNNAAIGGKNGPYIGLYTGQ